MKRTFPLSLITLVCAASAFADAKFEAVVAKDEDTKPTTTFAADIPQVMAFFHSTGTSKGDKIRGVWIAEDVGNAAPANTKIDEATITADKDDASGGFKLSAPTKGWPVGKYKVEIYDGDGLATTVKFTIKAGKSEKKDAADDESSED
ncbi:MAG: hypothetical protein QOE73_2627 [Verrucomicrobiota bacterium]